MSWRGLASRLPASWQHELKRLHYRRQISRGAFVTTEPEFAVVDRWVGPGDCVIDVGAHVGHYTMRFSDLVGPAGRVIAVEPLPENFALLAANVRRFRHANVTLLNVAASDRAAVVGMSVPGSEAGVKDTYRATVGAPGVGAPVAAMPLDSLEVEDRVRLIKIDAEGHDPAVLRGAIGLVKRDRPTLIIETCPPEAAGLLLALGYRAERLAGSPNTVYLAGGAESP